MTRTATVMLRSKMTVTVDNLNSEDYFAVSGNGELVLMRYDAPGLVNGAWAPGEWLSFAVDHGDESPPDVAQDAKPPIADKGADVEQVASRVSIFRHPEHADLDGVMNYLASLTRGRQTAADARNIYALIVEANAQ